MARCLPSFCWARSDTQQSARCWRPCRCDADPGRAAASAFSVVLPVLIAAVKASGGILSGDDVATVLPWLNLLIVYDVIFIAVAFMGFEFVVQE